MIWMWGDDTWELHMKDLISHTVWCNSKVWLSVKKEREREKVWGREKEREGDSERERKRG